MKASRKNRIGALLLALVLALGIGLPLAQGGLVAAETAVSIESGHPAHGCDGCSGDEEAAIDACLSICASACQDVLPEEPMALAPDGKRYFQLAEPVHCDWPGKTAHGPPRHLILG